MESYTAFDPIGLPAEPVLPPARPEALTGREAPYLLGVPNNGIFLNTLYI